MLERYHWRPNLEKNGGVMAVDLGGKPVAHYYERQLSLLSSGIKIGKYLYCGFVFRPYMIRLDLHHHAAAVSTPT